MPIGCSSGCKTFKTLSTMEWIAQHNLRINHIIHLLDDFLLSLNHYARMSYTYSVTYVHTLAFP